LEGYAKEEIAGENEYTYTDKSNTENLNYYYNNLAHIINNKKEKGRILDIGCSAGYFLDCMPGWECHGIEPADYQSGMARKKYGNNIHTGTLEDKEYQVGYFDVITLQDVLDHMQDPVKTLKRCHSLLKDDGLLIVKVHDVASVFARIMRSKYYAFIPPFHLCYFNRKNLISTLISCGFKAQEYKYMDQVLFLKTILFRLSQNNKKSIYYNLFNLLSVLPFKDLKIKKNLYDIITVLAVKNKTAS